MNDTAPAGGRRAQGGVIAECYQVVGAAGEIGYRVEDIGRRRAQEGGSRHGVAGEEVLQGGGGTFSRVTAVGELEGEGGERRRGVKGCCRG